MEALEGFFIWTKDAIYELVPKVLASFCFSANAFFDLFDLRKLQREYSATSSLPMITKTPSLWGRPLSSMCLGSMSSSLTNTSTLVNMAEPWSTFLSLSICYMIS